VLVPLFFVGVDMWAALDEWIGAVVEMVQRNPRAFAIGFVVAVVVFTMPRAHAQLSIAICGSSTYTCPSDVNGSDSTFGGRNILSETAMDGVIGEGVKTLNVFDPVTGSSLSVPLSPNVPLATPSGWTPPASGSTAPIPPNSAAATPYYMLASGDPTHYPDPSSACAAWMANSPGWTLIQTTPSCVASFDQNPATHSNMGYSTGYNCPSGYGNLSGSVCTLVSAPDVNKPADARPGATRTGNAFVSDAHDPDNSGAAATALNFTSSNTNMSASSARQNVSVTIAADGKASVVVSGPGDRPGTTKTTTVDVSAPDANGNVSVLGTITATTQGAGTLNDPNAGAGATSHGLDPCGLPGTSPCKLDETGVAGSDTAARNTADTNLAVITNAKDAATAAQSSGDMSYFGLGKYIAPSDDSSRPGPHLQGSGDCSPPVISWLGQDMSLTGVCTIAGVGKPLIEWFLTVYAGLYAWAAYARRGGA